MKKYSNKLILMVLSIVMLFSLAIGIGCDCGGEDPATGGNNWTPIEKTATVTLNKSSENLIVGDYLTVVATTNKVLDEDVVYESEDPSIATVSERGVIEAINAGTTNIVAKYGKATSKCAITVAWDETSPVLIDEDGLETSYVVYKNSSFEFRPAIKYRGRIYYDAEFNFVSNDANVVTFEDNVLKASANVGDSASCYIEATWRGFNVSSAPLLRSDFTVEIKKEAYITLKGTSEDFVKLYTRNEFEGKSYVSESTIIPEFYVEGQKVDVEFTTEIEDAELAYYEDNKVKAMKFGETQVIISCEHEGQKYVKTIAIEIERPIADYQKEIGKFSNDIGVYKDINDDFARKTIAEAIYGTNDVTIIEAYQDNIRLSVEDNKIFGVVGLTDDVAHTIITIGTATEIYNVPLEVYGLYITHMEDFNFFTYTTSATNYYYLARDIDAKGFAFDYSGSCTCKTGLLGVFEGNGHVISNLDCKSCGLFGIVNGGTVQNIGFTNVNLTGYYGSLIGHKEEGKAVLKNIYVELKSVNVRGGGLYQQKMSPSGTHENIVVEYDISQDDVRAYLAKSDNTGNISTFAPNRAVLYTDKSFKNCFSISYAPVGCSSPKGSDFSWASLVMAENQVIQGDSDAEGNIPLTGVTDWDKELLAESTATDVLKTKSVTASGGASSGTDVLKGVKAYGTYADMINDKANNEIILSTFDKEYWVVINGVPYWKGVYVNSFEVSIKNGETPVEGKVILSNDTTELTIDLVDANGNTVDTTIDGVEGLIVNGNKVKLATAPTSKGSYEITATAIVAGVVVEKVITIHYSNEIEVGGKVLYSKDDKALDLESLNKALDAVDFNAITLDDIDLYKVNGEEFDVLDLEVIISYNSSVNYGRNRVVDTAQEVIIVVNGKTIVLNTVYAYSKIIDEAEDLKFFIMDAVRPRNELNGYYIVTKNIDATNLELGEHQFENNIGAATPVPYPGNGYERDIGLKGVFDGQGYTIDGLTTPSTGLFGAGNSFIIKNIAFTNVHLTGYYPALFVHKFLRGKNYDNSFNGYEGLISNVYVSVASSEKSKSERTGILANETLPAATAVRNVVVDFLNVNAEVQELIDAGKSFYMLGSSTFSMASSTSTYKDCYAISTAPVLQSKKMPGFAENQVEFTLTGSKVTAVGAILDPQVTEVLARSNADQQTLKVDHVIVGLRAYKDYAAMKAANNDYSTFSTDYWSIVDGVPTWNTAN